MSSQFLRLNHDVLVGLFVRMDARDLGRVAATCRLLQYRQRSPQMPNPVEDALRLRAELSGWSKRLPMDSDGAFKYLLRLAWQESLEFRFMFAARERPISLFVDSGGSLRSCGVELHHNDDTESFLDNYHAAPAGSLGFGSDWCGDSGSAYLRIEDPTLVPAVKGVRIRSMAIGAKHALALNDEGQVYMWGASSRTSRAPPVPALFRELGELKMRRVAAGTGHSAALTDEGQLYTWWDDRECLNFDQGSAAGAGYPPPDDLDDVERALCCPKYVEALAGNRVVSVAAGLQYTIVATDQGMEDGTRLRLRL